jgi:ribosomal protein L18
MKSKKTARLRRAQRGRAKMRELLVPRLSVYRSPRHIYAQVISEDGSSVKAAASTLEKDLREKNLMVKHSSHLQKRLLLRRQCLYLVSQHMFQLYLML